MAPTPTPTPTLAGLTRNKPLLYGGVAAVGLGVVAYVRSRGSSSGGGSDQIATGAAAGSPAPFESVGTDLRASIGDLSSSLNDQIAAYTAQLGELQDALGSMSKPSAPTTGPTTTPTTPTKPKVPLRPPGWVKPGQPPAKAPKKTPKYIRIPQNATLSSLARQNKTTVKALLKLNPSIRDPDRIYAGSRLRVA